MHRAPRTHGLKDGQRHNYTKSELKPWFEWSRATAESGTPGFIFFNNDVDAHAPVNALEVIRQLGPLATWTGLEENEAPAEYGESRYGRTADAEAPPSCP